jgi:hypothetical protein
MQTNSQSFQDIFALEICKNKTYIEIGANRPIKRNNTLLLEQNNFLGYSVEFNIKWQRFWQKAKRKNNIYFANAITFDYATANAENNLNNNIGYLSCDIEPVANTFSALKKVLNDGVTFECITFEHDYYQSDTDLRPKVDSFLKKRGYKIAVYNVYLYPEKQNLFETWYVHQSIDFETVSFDEWIKKNIPLN